MIEKILFFIISIIIMIAAKWIIPLAAIVLVIVFIILFIINEHSLNLDDENKDNRINDDIIITGQSYIRKFPNRPKYHIKNEDVEYE